jgi:nucleotide-binding universal stress UspA family protein
METLIYVQDLNAGKPPKDVLDQTITWLKSTGEKAHVTLLHVVDEKAIEDAVVSGAHVGTGFMDTNGLRRTITEGSIKKGLKYLRAFKEELKSAGFGAVTSMEIGNPVQTVIQESKFARADVVLIVKNKLGFFGALFVEDSYGHIAREIVNRSEVPVVIVTPKSIRLTDLGRGRPRGVTGPMHAKEGFLR